MTSGACWRLVAIVAGTVLSTETASANPADTYGLGSRPIAMGGAVSADVTGFAANYYNPSGLVMADHLGLGAGVQVVTPRLQLDGERSPVSSFRALMLGFSAPGTVLGVPVAFGLGAHLTGNRLSRIVTFSDEDVRWVLHEHRPEQIFVASSVALRPTEWLAFGAGVGFLASTDGILRIGGQAAQPEFAGQTEYDSRLFHEVTAELRNERYPILGLTLLPTERVKLALVYRGQSSVVLDVDAEFDGAISLGPLDLPTYYLLESQTVQAFVPRQLVLGGSVGPVEDLRLGLDVVWSDWSSYQSPLSATHSELDLDSRGLLLQLPELPADTQLTSARLSDRITPRLGGEYRTGVGNTWELSARVGYVFERTPLAADSSPNLADADRHVMSLGAGVGAPGLWPVSGMLRLDTHLQWSLFTPRSFDGPDGRRRRASGDIWTFGFTLTVEP